ncbi:unnamed protein product [Caenorhabditis angaria]|uniref:Sodium/calcium exchanger membrane region domain-containing protein n=1 Tax=Caenorhabditis angaria TaxID=860376 RepID=A0A9P1IZ35_9PELO|nr:unnamed protein product [Caenorhabditis angaria]
MRRCFRLSRDERILSRQIGVLIFAAAFFAVICLSSTVFGGGNGSDEILVSRRVKRDSSKYEFDDCKPRIQPGSSTNSSQFPADFLSMESKRRGAVMIHIGLLIYMFVALAVVCDEFFVPSLSVITEVLTISDDVAGATFMAAGGSAPEFFTSLFGVFIAQDNVGVGTIVGSATFNILCVLAFCTLFSRQVLHLTWWPLFRDMSFYTLSLFLLLIFFGDEQIEWFEAFTMFAIYITYGFFMKYNADIETTVKLFLFNNFGMGKQLSPNPNAEHAHNAGHTPRSAEALGAGGPRRSFPMLHGGQEVRKSIAQLVIGDVEESASSESTERSTEGSEKVANGRTIMVKPKNPDDPDEMFVKQNNITTVAAFVEFGNNNNNEKKNGTYLTPIDKPMHLEVPSATHVPPIMLDNVSRLSMASSNAEQPLDLSWPESTHKRLLYIFLAPITFPLAFTLPDVRKQNLRKFFAITFVGSILWIAAYSYLMVWWANTIGETFGIPTEIMGLTILAAGTSIPDLITSVIVARKGLGDMAVSSSIGSNLFDVCVGLPIPWLIHFSLGVLKGNVENISVTSNGLVCSLGLLFGMLLVLLACVAISRWKMDKFFGLLMIFSYCAFCMLCIFLETGHLKCPLRNSC